MELKPCPFCGFPVDYVSGSDDVNGGPYWYVSCPKCGASVYGSESQEAAIEAWNRRTDHAKT